MNIWRDIEKAKPNQDKNYLVCTKDSDILIAEFSVFLKVFTLPEGFEGWTLVTHWMPLPEPPKE